MECYRWFVIGIDWFGLNLCFLAIYDLFLESMLNGNGINFGSTLPRSYLFVAQSQSTYI